ncbi:hypothetical protein TEA_017603 [Camellia sinensis var. sinensis]|uniref:Glycoside hydrolase family 19 catalytic domain-containing protein n=1 Tax=Camellia sinensis var. sinensis TaxID=542762 RepID=A0A4S4D031_CAMSN|nr:hypothetical protein TEA_017603 [Camellia sinensis var. sinensis]
MLYLEIVIRVGVHGQQSLNFQLFGRKGSFYYSAFYYAMSSYCNPPPVLDLAVGCDHKSCLRWISSSSSSSGRTLGQTVLLHVGANLSNVTSAGRHTQMESVRSYILACGFLIGRTLAVLVTMTRGTSMAARQGTALIASSYSKGDYRTSREVANFALKVSHSYRIAHKVSLAAILGLSFGSLATLFTKDAEVLGVVRTGVLFVSASQPVNALAFIFYGLHYGVSDFPYAACSMMVVGAICSSFLLYVPSIFGLHGVWAGLALFMGLRTLAGYIRISSKNGPWWFLHQDLKGSEVYQFGNESLLPLRVPSHVLAELIIAPYMKGTNARCPVVLSECRFMYLSHSNTSFSVSLMLGSLNVPSKSSASHRHLISEVYREALGLDLLNNPDLVQTDPVISFRIALWFWMTSQSPKPSCHAVITETWTSSAAGQSESRVPEYGVITNIIYGNLECSNGMDSRVESRIGFYQRYCSDEIFGVSTGDNLDCNNQRPFGFGLLFDSM